MTSSAAPVADETPLDETFWDLLPTGHRVALLASPVMLLGALGPWFDGTRIRASFAAPGAEQAVAYGFAWEGWLVAAPAILAMLVLGLVKDRQKRSARALSLLLVATLLAAAQWYVLAVGDVVSTLFGSGPWTNVSLQWGLPLAVLAGLVGVGGALAGSRDPNQTPTY